MNKIIQGDCLEIMKTMESDSIDLIATDPPFNTGRVWKSKAGEFDDRFENTHAFVEWMRPRVKEMRRLLKSSGSLYLHCDPTASHYIKVMLDEEFGQENFQNEIIWSYRTGGVSKRRFAKKHDAILFYTKGDGYVFNLQKEKAYSKVKNHRTGIVKIGAGEAEYFKDEKGVYSFVNMRDVWDISYVNSTGSERTGYPTQKPLALYERIITASSNEGDIVFDPFCGSGTTLVTAQQLGRRCIGIDRNPDAVELAEKRLLNA